MTMHSRALAFNAAQLAVQEIVFIDQGITDFQRLALGVKPGIEVHLLEAHAIAQITTVLAGRSDITTVHIISHGSPGCLYLGNETLELNNLSHHSTSIKQWFATAQETPQLLLYGCNVAVGDGGQEFLDKLHQLTGGQLFASSSLTGNSALGGDWDLQAHVSSKQAVLAVQPEVMARYGHVLAPTISNLDDAAYTEQAPAITIDSDVTFSGGGNYSGGSIQFSLNTADSTDNLTLIDDGTASTANGVLSIVGTTVFLGDGTNAAVVGSVDSTLNGQNGQPLQINFSNEFENGDFNLGTPGQTSITGWTTVNQQVKFGTDTIAGLPTPIDNTIPVSPNADQNTPSNPGTMVTVLDAIQNDGGGTSVRLTSSGITTAQGRDIVRGPYIYSNGTVSLSAGDQVSFEWQAQGGDDAYDVYGYIVDVNTGDIVTILDETGNSANAATTWATETVTVSTAGDYRFVFVAGTYDFTGGLAAGAQLFIDDVTVTQAVPPPTLNDSHISEIAQSVQYSSTSDNPDATKTLTIDVENGASETASDTAVISITPVDDAGAIAGDTSATGDEDATLTGTVTANDPDGIADGTIFSIETGDGADNGTATIDPATGAWSYTPTSNFNGSDDFTVTLTDDQGGTTTQVITLTVNAIDDVAVVTGDTTATGDEEATLTGTLNATDTEGLTDGSYFSIETGDGAENGTASIDPETGAWSYTPATDFSGSDDFTVTITDDQGGTTTQVINLTVDAVDDVAVVTGNTSATGDEDATLSGTLSATDAEGLTDGTYFSIETGDGAANGTASIDPETGAWSYTPTENFSGSDTFTVTITDDQGGTTTQEISLTVNAVDDATVTGGDTSATGDEEATLSGTLSATDAEGLTDGTYFSIETGDGAANGTASIDPETGAWSYTPTENFSGSDTFTVTITDDQGGTTTQEISLTVNAVDDATVTGGDTSATGDEEATLSGTLSATDAEGLTDGTYFSIETGDGAANGTASIDPETGAWSYTPTENFSGSDTFTVTITDDQGGTTTQEISLTVNAVDDATVTGGDTSATGDEEATLSGTLSATDAEGLTDGTYFSIETGDGAANGTASIDPETGAWSYTPTENFSGSDTFTVTITDDQGGTTTQVIGLTVNAVNDLPVILANQLPSLQEGETVTLTTNDLNASDADHGAEDLIYTISDIASGEFSGEGVTDNGDGTVSFTQAALEAGLVQFTHDGGEDPHSYSVSLSDRADALATPLPEAATEPLGGGFTPVNDPAAIVGDTSATGGEDSPLTGTLTANDPEGLTDGTYFSIEAEDGAVNGTASIDPETGAWSYTPAENFSGSDSFTVTITDDQDSTTTQVITLTVDAVNDLPVILVNQLPSLQEGETVTLTPTDLDASDADHGAEDLIYTISDIANGEFSGEGVTDNGNGTVSFTQAALEAGLVQFTHDGSEDPHTYSVSLSDRADALATTLPQDAAQPTDGSFTPVNDGPSFNAEIPSTLLLSRDGASTLEFTIDDADSTIAELTVTATSTNGELLPEGSLSLSGTGNSRTLSATPQFFKNAAQSATINLSLSDGETTISQTIEATLPVQRAATDVDIDGTSEILWRSSNDSSILMWKMEDNGVVSQSTFAATIPDKPWNMAGTADFDGDDQLDLIGRSQETGDIKIWLLDANQQLKGEVEVAPQNRPGQDWQIVGIDDFNGDDTADILWRHQTSGQFLNWYLGGAQGGELTGGALFDLSLLNLGTEGVFPDLNWKVAGTGDFNDDNAADIVWHHQETNQISIWHMDEQATLIGGYVLDGSPDSNWEIVGSGDFDGNGKSDLFWKHKTAGETAIWSLDQGVTIGGGALGSVDLNAWQHFV